MKKVLGLDLGISSIGWALIDEDDYKILGMGSRIIPISTDEKTEFSSGNKISKNQKRTQKRTQRKGYDRYQLRRKYLVDKLNESGMFPGEELTGIEKLQLWGLRAGAVKEKVSLKELGRILLHLNQKRGYKSARTEANLTKEDTEYVSKVKNRHQVLRDAGITIGQKFYHELTQNSNYRTKEQVYPREAYMEEFDAIIAKQREFYPNVLTAEWVNEVRNSIIYYQRRLKSQKRLVSVCELEGFYGKIKTDGHEKELLLGPKVAPKSSPLAEVCKIWETINNIRIKQRNGDEVKLTLAQKNEIFKVMDDKEKLTFSELLKILGLKKDDIYGNKQLENGLKGNITKSVIRKCLSHEEAESGLLNFEIKINKSDEEVYCVDKSTGEVINSKKKKVVDASVEDQPLYKIWHIIYSIPDKGQCISTLIKKFGLEQRSAEKLTDLDLKVRGFGAKSHRAMRKLLPYLMEGDDYYTASSFAGYNHANVLTKEENASRKLAGQLKLLDKNALRQPVVEKILNQMINVVNRIITKYGRPDEIRIELARELKQSREERNETYKYISQRSKENEKIAERLQEFNLRTTRNNTIKWRLYHELSNGEKRLHAICVYCGNAISFSDTINGDEVDVEHIIPKSLVFDDSQSNKTLAHRKCNADKGDKTAYDFMTGKSDSELQAYIERIGGLYKDKLIGRVKRDNLLRKAKDIKPDFINRQLRETQYITRKAREILLQICTNVWVTTGAVTAELRHIWGWDDVLMNLQLPKYRELGLTEKTIIDKNGRGQEKEIIRGWSKRDDHRHHAIDALVIACTKQSMVHRLNTLSSSQTRDEMKNNIRNYDRKKNLLENYILSNKPFQTKEVEDAAAGILISIKSGKKVATMGKRKVRKAGKLTVVQEGIIVPRGALSEESVYGKIKNLESKPIREAFKNPDSIYKENIRRLVKERLALFDGNVTRAVNSLRKDPIFLDTEKKTELTFASCFTEEVVIKKPISSFDKEKQLEDIVDPVVKRKIQERIKQAGGKIKDALKDLEQNPVWFNKEAGIPIKSVRCKTGLSAIEPAKPEAANKEAAGFVKPGNNHHLAIYLDENGKKTVSNCTFWHAVERKKYGLPVIIKKPEQVFDEVISQNPDIYRDDFLVKLPGVQWKFVESYQQNEMVLLGMEPEQAELAINNNDMKVISKYLYRVQKLGMIGNQINIQFRHHLETEIVDSQESREAKRFYHIQSLTALDALNPKKIFINCIGDFSNTINN